MNKLLTDKFLYDNLTIVQNFERIGGEQMAFNYSKLKGKIVEKYGTQSSFASAMGWSERTLSLKMTCRIPWKQEDIVKAVELLELDESDIPAYFFAREVQNIEL